MALTWLFDPDRSDDGVVVNKIGTDTPEFTPGKQIRMEFVFWDERYVDDYLPGGTAGGPQGFTAGGATGAAAGIEGDRILGHVDRYEAVRDYFDYAGRWTTFEAIDGTVKVVDRTPSSASISSIIVALESGTDYVSRPGVWVALDSVDDETNNPTDIARMTVRMTVLARRDDYATRSDLKNDIGVTI